MDNPLDETHRASCLRENLTSSSYGEGLETDRATTQVARQSLTRQLKYDGFRALAVIENGRAQLLFSQRASVSFLCGGKPDRGLSPTLRPPPSLLLPLPVPLSARS